MSHLMHPIPFGQMIEWILTEYSEQGAVFGIRKDKFYKGGGTTLDWFGEKLATVIGPAAGPHSQLTQNIVAAYLAGSRFVELKTVQKMDGAELQACVPRPCINAQDECYNQEWSTELTVPVAHAEYVKAWIALHVLAKEFGISDQRDFVFNMSVGYDLDGIKLPKVDNYIEGMKDASKTDVWKECMAWLGQNLDRFQNFGAADLEAISPKVCSSITLSTLHGCPPDEIERIARYLLEEKKMVTFVKCNPTLLGYETARSILDGMGYDYISFDDHHFKADLQFSDAVAMFRRLQALAAELKLGFGVKLTNTFPVEQKRGELPGEEMYMSGRALLPLTLRVGRRLSREFQGALPISYSGGADIGNIDRIFGTGIFPITVATTLLKPGGYERLHELAELLEPLMAKVPPQIDAPAVCKLAEEILTESRYLKSARTYQSRKTDSELGQYDCFKAPCKEGGCPIAQQVPEYLKLVADGKLDEAFRVIAIDNATPAITPVICNHECQSKCTRMDYEAPIHIRNMKRLAVEGAQDRYTAATKAVELKTGKKAVVIGAGPAGVAAGLFLRRNGVAVTVLEKRESAFGIVEHVIPSFRIAPDMIRRDYELAKAAGVEFRFGVSADYSVEELKKEYDYVLIATGAWKEGHCPVKEGGDKMVDALDFLQKAKANDGRYSGLGKRVAVIGGGDVAMDCARVAARDPGCDEVTIVYRRTREFMPAEKEEINGALDDGAIMRELLAPKAYDGSTLTCEVMALGDWDESGRRGIVSTGEITSLPFDTVIAAVGARVDTTEMAANGLLVDDRGRVSCSAANESSVKNVYVLGDCRKGPATIVKAVADAKAAVMDILHKENLPHDFVRVEVPQEAEELYRRKGISWREVPATEPYEGNRCLVCDQLCEICNDVCPNRANIHVAVDSGVFGQDHQVLHLDGMCNECGNCTNFCPHTGDPYRDKVTVFWSEEEFTDSENVGFVHLGDDRYKVRCEDGKIAEYTVGGSNISPQLQALIAAVRKDYAYYLTVGNQPDFALTLS